MEENKNGDFYPKLDPNYNPNNPNDYYDIKVEVPPNLETINNKKLINNNTTYTISELMTDTNKNGITKDSTLLVEVSSPIVGFANIKDNGQYLPNNFDNETGNLLPEGQTSNNQYLNQINVSVPQQTITNPLEKLTNKRLDREITYTVSDLMSDSTNNAGITKDSTLIVDVPDPVYPEITFNTITQNDTNYTLSQLTNDQSEYFSRSSIIKCNITTPIKQTIHYVRFSDSGSKYNLTKGVKGNTYPVYQGQEVVIVNKENGQWRIRFYGNDLGNWTYYSTGNDYFIIGNYNTDRSVRFYNTDDVKLFSIADQTGGNEVYSIYLPETLYEFI